MKKFLTIFLGILLCIGVIGGSFALAKHIDGKITNEQSSEKPSTSDKDNDEGETLTEWSLCTDVSELAEGDQIVIVVEGHDYALGTTQNASNRSAVEVVKEGQTITFGDDVQVITLEAGMVENTFAFNVGDGYLYAPSSSSNQLKTHASIDENSSWSIVIDESGIASIVAQGASTKNILLYNMASNLFSCYSSTQESVVIYKLVDVEKE